MEQQVRLAVRRAATELSAEEIDQVAGGGGGSTVVNTPSDCHVDTASDCWINGGRVVSNDDAY